MTVSHLYYNGQVVDADVNYANYLKNPDQFLGYDINDPAFQALFQCIALGSKASFDYSPTIDEIKHFVAKKKGQKPKDFNKYTITDKEREEGLAAMIAAEAKVPIEDRKTIGDASESGLVKFCQPIMDLHDAR